MTIQDLRTVYIQTLKDAIAAHPDAYADKSKNDPEGTVDKMLSAIDKCANVHGHTSKGCDWITLNAALRTAAKACGITSSAELRAFFTHA